MPVDVAFRSLIDLARLLAARKTTSREIVEAFLARIDAYDGKLHAYVDVWREDALARADASDRERADGLVRGPLHGLPVALKDLLHVEGRQTTAGSKSWLGRTSDVTATAVERLVTAGMIPLGKTHMVEFAFGGWGRNAPMGAPWNPWDARTHRVAGGSSSGSAVAVAAGLAPAAIGSDTGGSIRIPASLTGITGFKTTYGLISLYGVVPLSTTLDSLGPLTRTVEDAALVAAAMSGADPRDPSTFEAHRFDVRAALGGQSNIRGMRITAMPVEQFPPYTSAAVRATRDATIAVLRELGATVDEEPLPLDFDELMRRNGRLIAAEAYAVHRDYIEDEALDIDPWVRSRTVAGKSISAADYIDELAARRRIGDEFATWMRGRSALLTPTLPIVATPLADVDEATTPLASFTRAVNYVGACALSLPAGFSAEGLPIGMQLVGASFAEVSLVRIGRAFQHATDWHKRTPDLAAGRA
jgi:aspartyl-tRNA(Asn)/glutamyl-tRNA(Gln) amidotransferase subunit A